MHTVRSCLSRSLHHCAGPSSLLCEVELDCWVEACHSAAWNAACHQPDFGSTASQDAGGR